jgi:ArsR family transcriptional regulator
MTTQTLPVLRISPDTRRAIRGAASALAISAKGSGGRSAVPLIDAPILERAARVIRVLGHPLRLRLLEALEDGERHVTDLVAASGATQALVSQHLAILRAEGVVGARKEGLRVFYRITEPKVHRILACIRDCDLPELSASIAAAAYDLTPDA